LREKLMPLTRKNLCPLNGFEPCRELDCKFFEKVVGENPNTKETIDEWDCVIRFIPLLLIENSNLQRQTTATIDKFRKETQEANQISQRLLYSGFQNSNLIEGTSCE
jgi:hypothetical protein